DWSSDVCYSELTEKIPSSINIKKRAAAVKTGCILNQRIYLTCRFSLGSFCITFCVKSDGAEVCSTLLINETVRFNSRKCFWQPLHAAKCVLSCTSCSGVISSSIQSCIIYISAVLQSTSTTPLHVAKLFS